MMIENKGQLWFYDSARKFIKEEHSIKNLTREFDICVYSLTPTGQEKPEYLIAKVMKHGCMDAYLNPLVSSRSERCVVTAKYEYMQTDPMGLFNNVRTLTSFVNAFSDSCDLPETSFWTKTGYHHELITVEEFFSVEVDSASDDPGAKIYQQDKEYFLKNN